MNQEQPTIVFMMVGIPGSGKSTAAAKLQEEYLAEVHNADSIREELYGDASIQGDGKEVFGLLYSRARADVSIGCPVILDNCNVSRRDRKRAMKQFRNKNVRFIAVCVDTPVDECLRRNQTRDRVVPEWVINRAASRYKVPSLNEGFVEVRFV